MKSSLAVNISADSQLETSELAMPTTTPLSSQTVYAADAVPDIQVLEMALGQQLRHLCQKQNPFFNEDIRTAHLILDKPEAFFQFPLAAVLDPQNVTAHREQELQQFRAAFSAISEKQRTLDALLGFLNSQTPSSALRSQILLVADELFTNAVYNAPAAALNVHLQDRPRNNGDLKMSPGQLGQLGVGVSGDRLVLFCRDPYGTLNLATLVKRIIDCYSKGVSAMMNMGTGGAGIGSHMVFSAATSYFAAVKQGETTLLVCAFPLRMSNRKRAELPKNVHFVGF